MSDKVDPQVRRIRFDWTNRVDPDQWHHTMPEFGAGANAVSLMMPHAEPFVIQAIRRGLEECENPTPELRSAVNSWAGQEAAHFKQHRAFNKRLTEQSAIARFLDGAGKKVFAMLTRRSCAFGVAFAAAFELVAFSAARWAEAGLRRYFDGADERAATLFLWHLAEEIEHKGIAHDVAKAHPHAQQRMRIAILVAFVVLVGFTATGGVLLFLRTRAALNPFRWARLIAWGFSMNFEVLPVLSGALHRDFHPAQLVDPPWMAQWLREYDPIAETLPLWTHAGLGSATSAHTHGQVSGRPLSADEIPRRNGAAVRAHVSGESKELAESAQHF